MGIGKSFANLFGGIKGKIKPAAKALKSVDDDIIKTTSKLGSQTKIISGGTSVAKGSIGKFAKGVGSTANVGGKVFGVTGILGGTALAGGKIYDYLGDTFAVTQVQREYEHQIKLAGQEADVTKQAQTQYIDYLKALMDLRNAGQDSSALSASGGAGGLFPMSDAANAANATEASSRNIMWLALLGIAVVGGGTFVFSKKMKGVKK